jgi:hypothetical protein
VAAPGRQHPDVAEVAVALGAIAQPAGRLAQHGVADELAASEGAHVPVALEDTVGPGKEGLAAIEQQTEGRLDRAGSTDGQQRLLLGRPHIANLDLHAISAGTMT